MADLLSVIKLAGAQAVNSQNPVNILFGQVIKADPPEVQIDQRITLTADFLIVPESLTYFEVDITHNHSYIEGETSNALGKVVIRKGLNIGDKVILLRMQGGQKYLILDKVVDE